MGGRPRELLIRPFAARMASYRISALDLRRAIQASNSSVLAGSFDRSDQNMRVQAGQFIAKHDAQHKSVPVHGAARGIRFEVTVCSTSD